MLAPARALLSYSVPARVRLRRAVHRPARLLVLAAFATIYLVWGSTYLAIHVALEALPPFLLGGFRFTAAGLLLYGMARGRGAAAPRPEQWRGAAVVGGLMLGCGGGGVNWAEQHLASGTTALILATVPMWVVLLEWVIERKGRPSAAVVAGGVLGLVGVGVLCATAGIHGATLWEAAVPLAAAVAYAGGLLSSRRVALPRSLPLASGMQMLAGGAALLVLGWISGETVAVPSARSLVALAYLALVGSGLAFSALGYLVRNVRPAAVSTYAYVNPVIAVVLGWAVLGERLGPQVAGACVLILAAVGLMTVGGKRGGAR